MRTDKVVKHEGDGDANYSWNAWNSPQELKKKILDELEIWRKIGTIPITVCLG